MRSRLAVSILSLLPAACALAADFEKDIKPILTEYCSGCHNADKKKGDLDLDPVFAQLDLVRDHDIWEKVAELTVNREMPPEKKPQPSEEARHKVVQWIESSLATLAANEKPNPGRVTIRRLNKEEYRRTIRDLLLVDYQPQDFPNDEVGYGYNNIGDVLSLSPLLLEKYLAAADEISRKAIVADPPKVSKQKLRGDRFESTSEWVRPLDSRVLGLYREGEGTAKIDLIRRGEYIVRVRAYGELAGPEAPKLALKLKGDTVATFDVNTRKPKTFEARFTADAGVYRLGVAFLNNYNDSENPHPDPKLRGDRNLFVESVEIEGPLDGKPQPTVTKVEQSLWKLPPAAQAVDGKKMQFSSSGDAVAEWSFPVSDEYLIRVVAHGEQAGKEPARVRIGIDGKELGILDVTAAAGAEDVRTVRTTVEAGKHKIEVGFANDYYDAAKNADRNLWIHRVEVVGPINAAAPDLPRSHTQLVTRLPEPGQERAVAKEILGKFAQRAYRRPVTEAEVDRLVSFVELALKNNGTFLEGIQTAVQAAICAPQFLFRGELDPAETKPGEMRRLNDFEVASRLSYFLWSSMPDEELFGVAERGELLKDGNLEKQISRMLKDWRSRALVENFGGQWLQLHNVYEVDPDPVKYPSFSYELREDMKRETFAFFEAIIKEDRSILDLVDARFTFLNERLARHYGVEGVKGNEFRRVELAKDSPRGGVLTMGSILLATSMPTRTSPVIRGKWILEQILGTPPPPPPPNVPALDGAKNIDPNLPYKKRLELHRENADCAGCHAKIDPIGFALENFDAIGAFRTMDGPNPVDASGTLPNGTDIAGAGDLKRVLRGDRFVQNFIEQMMTYGLGRGLERYDKRAVSGVMEKARAAEFRFSTILSAIVLSDPFLQKKAPEPRLAGS